MNYNFEIKPRKIMFEHKHMDGVFKIGIKYKELVNKLLRLGYKKIQQTQEDSIFELNKLYRNITTFKYKKITLSR